MKKRDTSGADKKALLHMECHPDLTSQGCLWGHDVQDLFYFVLNKILGSAANFCIQRLFCVKPSDDRVCGFLVNAIHPGTGHGINISSFYMPFSSRLSKHRLQNGRRVSSEVWLRLKLWVVPHSPACHLWYWTQTFWQRAGAATATVSMPGTTE